MTREEHRAFWADGVADEIEARDPNDPIVIKGAVSPSGIPHIGHFNEIMRGYYVAEALRDRGHEVRQVFTADDRDALRALPRRLADADWRLVELGDVDAAALGRNLGVPYTDVPDPFDDGHDSYGDHFTALLRESAELVGVPVEFVSVSDLYESGAFDDVVRRVLERRETAREVIAEFQDGVGDDYVPFMPQCTSCGRLTTAVTGVDLEAGTVDYTCVGLEAGGQQIEGCGHRGTATFREGKLPWRFEWPADWEVLGVDFEPFGKDHAEGSWPSGQEIARRVLGIEPPVPMTYEWFTLDGAALSSSSGNVVTVPETLELIEPEVLRYFFAKSPRKQRDLDLSRIDRLVDEFDRFERSYFREDTASIDPEMADAAYPATIRPTVAGRFDTDGVPREPARSSATIHDGDQREHFDRLLDGTFAERERLPYAFAAVLGMTDDTELRLAMAHREGHLNPAAPGWAVELAMGRVAGARAWADRTDNEYNYRLAKELPETSISPAIEAALDDLAAFVATSDDGEAIQGEIYEAARRHDVDPADLFAAGYRLFLDRPRGPRLGPFLAALEREFVVRRLRRDG